ncbi:MAG: hypothetical protein ACNA7T_11450 [Haliea sp.]
MSTLRELQKLACLESLGLQLLVAKSPLPGAAPSVPRLALRAPAAPATMPRLDVGRKVPGPVSEAGQLAAEVNSPVAGLPAFHLAAIVAGGCLWLEPLPGPELEQEPLQLIRAMAFALQRRPDSPQVTRFDWPLHSNRQLDLSAAAAAAALTGFVLRQVQDRQCRALVLLGQAAGEHLLQPQLDGVPIVLLPATQELLAQPHSKRKAWQALALLGT